MPAHPTAPGLPGLPPSQPSGRRARLAARHAHVAPMGEFNGTRRRSTRLNVRIRAPQLAELRDGALGIRRRSCNTAEARRRRLAQQHAVADEASGQGQRQVRVAGNIGLTTLAGDITDCTPHA